MALQEGHPPGARPEALQVRCQARMGPRATAYGGVARHMYTLSRLDRALGKIGTSAEGRPCLTIAFHARPDLAPAHSSSTSPGVTKPAHSTADYLTSSEFEVDTGAEANKDSSLIDHRACHQRGSLNTRQDRARSHLRCGTAREPEGGTGC